MVLVNLDTRLVTQELQVESCCQVVHALPAPWACVTSGCNVLQVWAPTADDPHKIELVHTLDEIEGGLYGGLTVLQNASLFVESPDSAFGSNSIGDIRVFSVDPLKLVRVIGFESTTVTSVCGLIDVGGSLFAGCVCESVLEQDAIKTTICIWDAADGTTLHRFGSHTVNLATRRVWNASTSRTSWKLTADNLPASLSRPPTPLLLWNEASETLLVECVHISLALLPQYLLATGYVN